ncbi:OmpA family protein, partial [Acidisphaera rubrifaciens]|uniref:OmpA family protein n=1 Tax=Acidisphaera rubrifaciens TaxID=50715 RepID=UPI00066225F3
AKPAAPPAPPVAADAGSDALHMADGMRVMFQANHADLTPDTIEALKRFAASVPHAPDVTLDVRAYAATAADDPSAARRLSLSRSLAVRSVLMAEGFPSDRIFLRALGPHFSQGPADRCDILVGRIGAEPPPPDTGATKRGSATAAPA